jgi:ribosome-associated translation inhibitor RaiA
MVCRLNQQSTSFQQAADLLARTAHLDLNKESLRQLVEAEGKAVLRAMQRAELSPPWSAGDCQTEQNTTRVYAGCDGVKVPLITQQEKHKRRVKTREKRKLRGRKCKPLPRGKTGADCAYKDFKVAYLYDEAKKHRYVGVSAGNHEAAGRMLQRMSVQIAMPRADERVALIDGAPWIRNQFELHGLVDAIGLDFYHLQENAQKARRGIFGEESAEGRIWLGELMHTVKHDGYDAAWERVNDLRATLRSPTKRAAAKHLLGYMTEREEIIRYPEFRQKHWQIGSGPTEAECKTTTHRVKGRGRRWDSDNAEAMMALAALADSGLWHQRWQNLDPQRN